MGREIRRKVRSCGFPARADCHSAVWREDRDFCSAGQLMIIPPSCRIEMHKRPPKKFSCPEGKLLLVAQ